MSPTRICNYKGASYLNNLIVFLFIVMCAFVGLMLVVNIPAVIPISVLTILGVTWIALLMQSKKA